MYIKPTLNESLRVGDPCPTCMEEGKGGVLQLGGCGVCSPVLLVCSLQSVLHPWRYGNSAEILSKKTTK